MSVHQLLANAAQACGRAVAVRHLGYACTWRSLQERVARRAASLRATGTAPGDRVAVLAANVPEHLEAIYAVLWAGMVLVPLNTRLAAAEQAFILRHAGCTRLWHDDRYAARAQALSSECDGLSTTRLDPIDSWGRDDGMADLDPWPFAPAARGATAAIIYTGGTTGVPKGVELSHEALLLQALAAQHNFRLDESTVFVHSAPMFHVADFTAGLGVTAAAARHCFLPEFSPAALLNEIEGEGVDVAILVPTMITATLDGARDRPGIVQRLRTILYGAAPIQEPVLRRLMQEAPGVGLIQVYGQTEVGGACTMLKERHHVLEGPLAGKTHSAGHATATFLMRVTDDDGRELPPGQPGEISVRGPGMMLGYWKDPQLTAATIRDGWLHTGDIGIFDEDGFVTIAGRLKDMIITGGENVFAGEVESALMYHPAVAEAAVIGVPDPKWGETVHAVVVPKPGAAPDPQELIAHCRTLIAGYKCPRTVEIRRASLPLSGVGKVRKNELREEWNEAHKGASNVVQ